MVGKVAGAVPGSNHWLRNARSLLCESDLHGLIDQAVVFGMEDRVYGGEADILVHTAVAGDVVSVEQLVVVGPRRLCSADDVVVSASADRDRRWVGAVRDVDQELVTGGHRVCQADRGSPLPSTRTSSAVSAMPSAPFIITIGRPWAPLMKLP